jgi:hypothetical protein
MCSNFVCKIRNLYCYAVFWRFSVGVFGGAAAFVDVLMWMAAQWFAVEMCDPNNSVGARRNDAQLKGYCWFHHLLLLFLFVF